MVKICSKCHVELPLSEFYENRRGGECKTCHRASAAAWQRANPEKHAAANAAWRRANPEKQAIYDATWAKAHPEKAKAYHAAYRAAHPNHLYCAWSSMKGRCINPANPAYKNYGGRGIAVCDRWLEEDGFSNFVADVGERPSPKHSLDRTDVDGNYEPSNCRWATTIEQRANQRPKVFVATALAAVVELFGPESGARFAAYLAAA